MTEAKNRDGDGAPPGRADRAARRKAKLAEALRANLLKRKQQKRDRALAIEIDDDTRRQD